MNSNEPSKPWWRRQANWIMACVIAAVASFFTIYAWSLWRQHHIAQAERLYEEFQTTLAASTIEATGALKPTHRQRVMRIVDDMTLHFARTPYATMMALAVARALYRAEDLPGAKVQLQWVMQHALDNAYQQIARLRLAGLLYEEKAYDAAQKLLAIQPLKAFEGLYADRLGDILVAQNNFQAARQSYKKALDTLDINDLSARMVRLKLDALGSA